MWKALVRAANSRIKGSEYQFKWDVAWMIEVLQRQWNEVDWEVGDCCQDLTDTHGDANELSKLQGSSQHNLYTSFECQTQVAW